MVRKMGFAGTPDHGTDFGGYITHEKENEDAMSDRKTVVHIVSGKNAHRQTSVIPPSGDARGMPYHHRQLEKGTFGVNLTIDLGRMEGKPMTTEQRLALHRVLLCMLMNVLDSDSPLVTGAMPDAATAEEQIVPLPSQGEVPQPTTFIRELLLASVPEEERDMVQRLLEGGRITEEEIQTAAGYAIQKGTCVLDALISLKFISSRQAAEEKAAYAGRHFIDLNNIAILPEVIEAVSSRMALKYRIIPVRWERRSLIVATDTILDWHALDDLRFLLNVDFEHRIAEKEAIDRAIEKYYPNPEIGVSLEDSSDDDGDKLAPALGIDLADQERAANSVPVKHLVDNYLLQACKTRATTMILDTCKGKFDVWFIVKGVRLRMEAPPAHLGLAFVGRLKLLAELDVRVSETVTEKKVELVIGGIRVDLCVTFIPRDGKELVLIVFSYPSQDEGGEGEGSAPIEAKT
ncbi:MAG: hypothetical protein Q7S16_01350 [bacterium]|nr:hypothetical protein [bacterium]